PPTRRLMLLLDSEALSAIAQGPPGRRDRVRALVAEMRRLELPVATVAAVLAEVVRGHPRDAGVFAGVRRERVVVHPVDTRVGVRAGQLLGSAGAGSDRAIDAFVVAVADLEGGAVVATVDTEDIELLAPYASNVAVVRIVG
ncbi:MAG: PIN domain-containing protein, partial [Actinomycetota bacterium]|nr:PIN domain-containing protein [Actinomycetota bacterium]